ncbi:MAG: 9-O-acetylesterase [Tannerellaceae bacterium]|nr:9-O-acetylesterase [Tannerellaceae bacterium]
MKARRFLFPVTLLLMCSFSLFSQLTLPRIFTDNMLLQRDAPVKIWGTASPKETVTVSFNNQKVTAKADAKGNWTALLKPMAWGGPYQLEVKGKSELLTFENVLIGDVWLCSGQSNMEWQVKETNNAAHEIATADYPQIRSFNVVKAIRFAPVSDLQGEWEMCTPETVGDFSAVGFYFARKLYEETGIPIGIINSSWGGTDIQPWTSMDSFEALGEQYMQRYSHLAIGDPETFITENSTKQAAYEEALRNDKGLAEKWYDPKTDIASWKKAPVPALWSNSDLQPVDGAVWFRYDVDLPEGVEASPAELSLAMIDDDDMSWVNGEWVGETHGHNVQRLYMLPAGTLRAGKNSIVVRVLDHMGDGGIYGDPLDVYLRIGGNLYSLAGEWSYKESVTDKMYGFVNMSPNIYPALLYNAMIHPMVNYRIKGAIWYQGENNANAAYEYRTLFPNLITDWREKWGYEFPFYWVQLANFMKKQDQPVESAWAELREAQTMTLSLPQTGQAVITDIGDAEDIHPRNKQDVGLRLALHALHKDYGRTEFVYSGPAFRSMEVKEGKAVISFDNADGGLDIRSRYGYVEGFAIAGADGIYHWAKAYEKDGQVYVYSDQVKTPVYVRYSWADNPDVNIYNKAGLPAVPFRTDDFRRK